MLDVIDRPFAVASFWQSSTIQTTMLQFELKLESHLRVCTNRNGISGNCRNPVWMKRTATNHPCHWFHHRLSCDKSARRNHDSKTLRIRNVSPIREKQIPNGYSECGCANAVQSQLVLRRVPIERIQSNYEKTQSPHKGAIQPGLNSIRSISLGQCIAHCSLRKMRQRCLGDSTHQWCGDFSSV